jgi:GDP-4-dehydro-6-deoxy-D-mannose reductase
MRVLVTGAGGFAGTHLTAALRVAGHEVHGIGRREAPGVAAVDIRDRQGVRALVRAVQPERVFHLAAQSRAGPSWEDPSTTYDVNVTGTHNLLDAIAEEAPSARVLIAGTSDVYGTVDRRDCPIPETAPIRPVSPYAVSKAAQEAVARMFADALGLHIVVTRAFMHTGPGQPETCVLSRWARTIAQAEVGRADPVIAVGRLDVMREICDVRDVIGAYVGVLEVAAAGSVFNVGTGDARSLDEALSLLLDMSTVEIRTRVDRSLIRPADPPILAGNPLELERVTGWKPAYRPEDTLGQLLDYWRRRAVGEGDG